MKLRELNVELVQANAIVLRYRKNDEHETLVEKIFENHSEFNKWFFEDNVFTKVADAEIGYISIDNKGTLTIRI